MKRNPSARIERREGVYKPAEDSELLLSVIDIRPGERVLDVGTGSGFLAVHCALAGAYVVATDIDSAAAECARASALQSGAEVRIVLCDIASAVRGEYDLVLFNAPYLPGKSGQIAVDGGAGGVELARRLLAEVPRLLSSRGRALLLLSSLSDATGLFQEFQSYAFQLIARRRIFFEELIVYEVRPPKK